MTISVIGLVETALQQTWSPAPCFLQFNLPSRQMRLIWTTYFTASHFLKLFVGIDIWQYGVDNIFVIPMGFWSSLSFNAPTLP